jgi:hypothetical protein
MDDNVVRLCINGRKIEPDMNAQLLHVTRRYAIPDWWLDEISAAPSEAKAASPYTQTKHRDRLSITAFLTAVHVVLGRA